MARCGDLFHTGENCIAYGALGTRRVTGFLAGSGLFRNFNRSMSSRVDCSGLGCRADRAGVGLDTGVLTGRRGRDHAVIPAVALGGNLFLFNNDFVADGAVLALGLAGLGAGGCLAGDRLLGVAVGGDFLLCNEYLVADGTLGAVRQAGLGAGGCLAGDRLLGVFLGGDDRALGDFLAADGADRITGVAVLGAGGILLVDHLGERMIVLPLGVEGGVLGQINSRTIRIGVASTIGRRIPVQEVVAFAGKRVCVQCGIGLRIYGLRGHRAFDRVFRTAVGFKGNRQLRGLFAAPNAINIVDDIASVCGRGFRIGTVGVVQLGGGDGDLMCRHVGIDLRVLIRRGLRAGSALLVVDTGAVAGADVRTALGGVDAAVGGQRTVDVHLHIDKVCICAVIMLSGGISYRTEIAFAGVCIDNPFVTVIDIDALAAGHHQLGVLGDGGLHAGQQRCRLIDSQLAAGGQIDGHVVGQRQDIAAGADARACQLQVQAVDLRHTVDGIVDAVGGAVIRLG